jgi:hypothetical protein
MQIVGLRDCTHRLPGFGQSPVQDEIRRAVAFASRARTDVVIPTLAKSATQLISPVQDLRDELRRVCGTGVGEDVEAGKFLQLLDCWITEAFGWWAQTEQIAVQTTDVGTALLKAASKPQVVPGDVTVPITLAERRKFAEQATRVGLNLQTTGNVLIAQALSWKPVLRNVLAVSHTLRDTVVLFNDAVDQGSLPNDAETETLRQSLEETVTAWKGDIVNRVVDAAFATRQFALQQATRNAEIVNAGFDLAALTPQALAVISQLKQRVDELADLLNLAALPGNALIGLGQMVSDAAGAVARGATNLVFDIAWKAAVLAGAVAVVGTGIAVVLKKTGVIGKKQRRRPGG